MNHHDYDANAAWLRFWLLHHSVQLYLHLTEQPYQVRLHWMDGRPEQQLYLTVRLCLQVQQLMKLQMQQMLLSLQQPVQ